MDKFDRYQGLNPNTTLKEAKAWLTARLDKGQRCCCCGQLAKFYYRRFYSSLAVALIYFYRNFDHSKFHHKNDLLAKAKPWLAGVLGGGDFSKCSLWGLIEEKPKDINKDTRTSGYWRITSKGIQFVEGTIRIPAKVKIFDSRVFGFSEETLCIKEALKKGYSYEELMTGPLDQAPRGGGSD